MDAEVLAGQLPYHLAERFLGGRSINYPGLLRLVIEIQRTRGRGRFRLGTVQPHGQLVRRLEAKCKLSVT